MGFSASQGRWEMLSARKSDLELQGQFLNQSKLAISNVVGALFNVSSNLDPSSPEAQQLQARLAAVSTIEKRLDAELQRIDSQREAVQTEIDSVKKVISKNISDTFKTFADLA